MSQSGRTGSPAQAKASQDSMRARGEEAKAQLEREKEEAKNQLKIAESHRKAYQTSSDPIKQEYHYNLWVMWNVLLYTNELLKIQGQIKDRGRGQQLGAYYNAFSPDDLFQHVALKLAVKATQPEQQELALAWLKKCADKKSERAIRAINKCKDSSNYFANAPTILKGLEDEQKKAKQAIEATKKEFATHYNNAIQKVSKEDPKTIADVAKSQYILGKYYGGKAPDIVTPNPELALKFHTDAAKNGHLDAQLALAGFFELSQNIYHDPEAALYWYAQAWSTCDPKLKSAIVCPSPTEESKGEKSPTEHKVLDSKEKDTIRSETPEEDEEKEKVKMLKEKIKSLWETIPPKKKKDLVEEKVLNELGIPVIMSRKGLMTWVKGLSASHENCIKALEAYVIMQQATDCNQAKIRAARKLITQLKEPATIPNLTNQDIAALTEKRWGPGKWLWGEQSDLATIINKFKITPATFKHQTPASSKKPGL